jgi:hypothetical protein
MEESERARFVERMIYLGFEVVQIMDQTSRVDYVKGEFERMKEAFDDQFKEIFSEEGKLPDLMDSYFGEKGDVTYLLTRHFGDEGSVLCNILNHSDEETPLGKFRKDLEKLLDIANEDTAFYKLKKCVEEGLNDLNTKIEVRDAAIQAQKQEREKSTAKGRDFQEFLTEVTDRIACQLDDKVTFVGDDTGLLNKVGDILIEINPSYTKGTPKSIIIEAKKAKISLTGKDSFLNELDEAIENRASDFAIGAIHEEFTDDSVGAFRRVSEDKILVSIPEDSYPLSLEVAYKVARAAIVSQILTSETEINSSQILEKIENIKSKLELMRATKSALTTSKGKIDIAYGYIEEMEQEIKDCINELTYMLKSGK